MERPGEGKYDHIKTSEDVIRYDGDFGEGVLVLYRSRQI